jgi:transglutaminase-like putative cysteine protease
VQTTTRLSARWAKRRTLANAGSPRPQPASIALLAIACLCLIASFAAGLLQAAEPGYVLHRAKSKTIRGTLAFEIHVPDLVVSEWIFFASKAPALPGQTDTQTRMSLGGEPYLDLSPRGHALLRARIPVADESRRHTLRGEIVWQATLYGRKLVKGPGDGQPHLLDVLNREAALVESPTLDYSARPFQDWLTRHRLQRASGESELDFARRTYLTITHAYHYDYEAKMDRRASHLCQTDQADCGGMCALFVAALRANGVPARMLFGRWAKSSHAGATLHGVAYIQQHVKAEFHVDGVGWVPADLSSGVTRDKTPEGLKYFGDDPGDFIAIHADPDFEVDSVHWGRKEIVLMQSYTYYVRGKGKLDNVTADRVWRVETLE